jgi:hypothetical protein
MNEISDTFLLSGTITNNSPNILFVFPSYRIEFWDGETWHELEYEPLNQPNWQTAPDIMDPDSSMDIGIVHWRFSEPIQSGSYRVRFGASEMDKNNFPLIAEFKITEGYLKDETNNLYSKVDSCSIKNGVMTVTFSAYADEPIDANVFLEVWVSNDNQAGQLTETYAINELKEYSISLSSRMFDPTEANTHVFYVAIYVGTTQHYFYFSDGESTDIGNNHTAIDSSPIENESITDSQ